MPLSFLSILGGGCSLIGTSTNLVVQGLLEENHLPLMGYFEIGWVGLPCAVPGRGLSPDTSKMRYEIRGLKGSCIELGQTVEG